MSIKMLLDSKLVSVTFHIRLHERVVYVQAISSQPKISWMHVQPNFIIHGILLRAFRARGSSDKTDKMLGFNDWLKLVLITSRSLFFPSI